MSDDREARYARHLMLPEFGRKGQAALEESNVACIGAGGLGSSALLYLATAGIGTIRIIDDDNVEISNTTTSNPRNKRSRKKKLIPQKNV